MYKENNTKLAKVSIYLLEKYRYDTNPYLYYVKQPAHISHQNELQAVNVRPISDHELRYK